MMNARFWSGLLAICVMRRFTASAALIGSDTLQAFSSVVIFGDSYTDDRVYSYTPAPGGNLSTDASTGGRVWPEYIQQYTGVNLYDYAVSGAVCDTYFSPNPRNGVKQNQIPTFLDDFEYTGDGALVVPANETIYVIWIGTNDLGPAGFFTDNRLNLTILDYVDCVYNQLDTLYEVGARNFVLLNNAPLNHAPEFALPEYGGTLDTQYWAEESEWSTNVTLVSEKMREYIALVNSIYEYRSQAEVLILDRYSESSFTVFDVYKLMEDIWHNPSEYLNGTVAPNVTSYITACGSACDDASVRDSYMWYDSLHPSEQTDRIIAREFVDIVTGNGTWGQTWTSSCE